MKKSISMICAATFAGSLLLTPTANAESTEIVEIVPINETLKNSKYMTITGEISNIVEETTGNFFATVNVEGEDGFGFYFNGETKIVDNTGESISLKEGMNFTAYLDTSKPMILIYPPRYSPDVIIVETEQPGTVELHQFDENLLNEEKDLIINVSKNTSIENLSGQTIDVKEMVEKDVLVFYEVALESYPRQVGPSKLVVLERELTNVEKAYQIVEMDSYEISGEVMIPLRKVAEQLGYKVDSTGEGAIVTKGNASFTITRGSTTYGFNKSIQQFTIAPAFLEKNKTYVPFEFLNVLIEQLDN